MSIIIDEFQSIPGRLRVAAGELRKLAAQHPGDTILRVFGEAESASAADTLSNVKPILPLPLSAQDARMIP